MRQLAQAVRPAPVVARPVSRSAAHPAPQAAAPSPAFVTSPEVAPVVAEEGRPLPAPVRSEMETALGHDLGSVRVHDGAGSARAAAEVDARAFTIGDHVGFGSAGFHPETPEGRGLLAHELVHVLQGGAPDHASAETEATAAVASLARGERPTLTRHPGPARLHRAPTDTPPPAPVPPAAPASAPGAAAAPSVSQTQPPPTGIPAIRLPAGMNVVTDDPPGIGTTELVVRVPQFTLPLEKGAGPWVQQAYNDAGSGGRLVFSPLIEGGRVAAYKEGSEDYKSVWLNKYGFTSTAAMANAFTSSTDPAVRTSLQDAAVRSTGHGLRTNLSQAHCDIDHIVEKQMGGTSIPSNLQLLTSSKNQASGRQTYQALVALVDAIRQTEMRGPNVRNLQIRIGAATVPQGSSDPSSVIEDHLRAGRVVGSAAVQTQAAGKPVALRAGGMSETAQVRDTGDSTLDAMTRRLVPGMRLTTYRRGAQGANSAQDTVLAVLDSRAMRASGSGPGARLVARRPAAAAGDGPPAATQPPQGAAPEPTAAPAGEARELRLEDRTQRLNFFYPYLSPGALTQLSLDEQGNLSGTGYIEPTIPIFRRLDVTFSRDTLALVAPLDKDKLRSPFPAGFRFTGGELALQLSPELVPRGNLTFSVGPAAQPLINGALSVTMTGGVLVASGDLAPARPIPGISSASGNVTWRSDTGWQGAIRATSSSIPNTTANLELGFRTDGGQFAPYAQGGLVSQVRNAQLGLTASWHGGPVSYSGHAVVERPLPMVDRVRLDGSYGERGLHLHGNAPIRWRNIESSIDLSYDRRPDEADGRFSGTATFQVRTAKAEGAVTLTYDNQGRFTGRGMLAYQVTPNLRPQLGIELTPDHRVKLTGEARVGDVPLTRMWPSPDGGRVSIISGVGVKFSIPTPVPAVTAYGEIRGSLGLGYGVGPVALRGVVLTGELYPFEDDPQIKAKLRGTFAVPAYAELYGTFGAYIGLEVALGAVGAKGGLEITPRLRISGEGGIAVDADYDSGGFSFAAEAYASGQLTASATVNLVADLYAAYGLFSHRWTYQVASVSAQIGPTVRLTIGRIAMSKTGEMTWPSLSQVRMEPQTIDPLGVVRDMLRRGEARET